MRRASNTLLLCILAVILLAVGFDGPASADDAGAMHSQALFRQLEKVDMGTDLYHLTAGQIVTCSGDPQVCQYKLNYNNQFPGERMSVLPGGRLNIQLINRLDGLGEDILSNLNPRVVGNNDTPDVKKMIAAASSVTNLHTHGLHVSPAERSDNVMLKIDKGNQNIYAIDLPREHAPGTHWYHAHLHGSTALQVQGGMAGALIVEPLSPEQSLNPPGFRVQEHVMVLQLGSGWELNKKEAADAAASLETRELRNLGPHVHRLRELIDVESAEDLLELANRLHGDDLENLMDSLKELRLDLPKAFVNGQENPLLKVQQDVAVQRLRVINAGSRLSDYKKLWIRNPSDQNKNLPMYVAAIDGVNLTKLPKDKDGRYIAYTKDYPLELAPGNRADIFVFPDTAGTFTLMMESEVGVRDEEGTILPASLDGETAGRGLKFQRTLLTLEVGGPDVEDVAAKAAGRATGSSTFLETLDHHLQHLQQTIPAYATGYLRPFEDEGDYIRRNIEFNVQQAKDRPFLINGRSYNAKDSDGHMAGHNDYLGKEADDGGQGPGPDKKSPWPLRAGTEEEWTITNLSKTQSGRSPRVHPFHVHVSPFWIVDIVEKNAAGELVSVKATNPYDPRLNRWQDTVTLPSDKGSVTVRHRVSEFTGLYVIHCHILQHEDRGMMINVLTMPNQHDDPEGYFQEVKNRNDEINREINGGAMVHAGH